MSLRRRNRLPSPRQTRLLPLLLVVFLSIVTSPATTLADITKGPCLLRVYQTRAALMWETDTEGAATVTYGTNGKPALSVKSHPEKVPHENDAFIHKVWIENLEPGQVYKYRIADIGSSSSTYRFRTVPSRTDAVTFVVYGDSRSHREHHRKLVEQMIKIQPDFVIHTGDLVTSGRWYRFWGPEFFEPLKGLVESVPIYITKGNHESNGGDFERLFVPPGEGNDFAFDYGPIHYVGADNVSREIDDNQLLNDIAENSKTSNALWKFVSYHEPSLNLGGHDSHWKRHGALPAFAQAKVDFVISGHSHLYERFRPVAPAQTSGSYVTYITSGGGGASTHHIKPTKYHSAVKAVRHFCVFRIHADSLSMDAIDENGQIIDHFQVTKQNGRLDNRYIGTAVPMDSLPLR